MPMTNLEWRMTKELLINDEARMTNDEGMTKSEREKPPQRR